MTLAEQGNRVASAKRWAQLARERLRQEAEDYVHSSTIDRAYLEGLQELRAGLLDIERRLEEIEKRIVRKMGEGDA